MSVDDRVEQTSPPIVKLRDLAVGTEITSSGSTNARMGLTDEPVETTYRYRRPLLATFLGCAFCVGFWISILAYVFWIYEPTWALYAAFPFALSGAVGLVAKNLD